MSAKNTKNKKVKIAGKSSVKRRNAERNEVTFLYILVVFIVVASFVISLVSDKYEQPVPTTETISQSIEANTKKNKNNKNTTVEVETTQSVVED